MTTSNPRDHIRDAVTLRRLDESGNAQAKTLALELTCAIAERDYRRQKHADATGADKASRYNALLASERALDSKRGQAKELLARLGMKRKPVRRMVALRLVTG